jgi:uroporphyrinogen decarboxylase
MENAMTPRERMMTALRGGQPDRVPAAPDISNMIPCRLTGKPFWDIYLNDDPPLWKAYLAAVRRYGIDGWFNYDRLDYRTKWNVEREERRYYDAGTGRYYKREIAHTPHGDLTSLTAYPPADPPTVVEKYVKNFKEDFPKLLHLYPPITGCDDTRFREQKKALGDLGIMGASCSPPGFHILHGIFQGSIEAITYAYYDHHDLFRELADVMERRAVEQARLAIEAGTDSILTGGSGSLTLQSPEIWRELSLPGLKKITRLCREAGVISGIHSCGRERYMVGVCAEETDLDYINPLEIPPMGDCDLAECKRAVGGRLALFGNLHTTQVMLRGSPADVKRESLKAIRDAGEGGGFVLSTGDQCGRDTPEENLLAMVDAAREFGRYPLDLQRIEGEIRLLENNR